MDAPPSAAQLHEPSVLRASALAMDPSRWQRAGCWMLLQDPLMAVALEQQPARAGVLWPRMRWGNMSRPRNQLLPSHELAGTWQRLTRFLLC